MEIYFDENGKVHEKPKDIKPEWRISGYVIIRSDDGKILMVQPTWNNNWELPGGEIEIVESIKNGIIRECHEETGYKIEVDNDLISIGERNFFSKAMGQFFKAVILVYSGRLLNIIQDCDAINTAEIARAEWVNPELLNELNVHPIVWPAICKFLGLQN